MKFMKYARRRMQAAKLSSSDRDRAILCILHMCTVIIPIYPLVPKLCVYIIVLLYSPTTIIVHTPPCSCTAQQ